ncbi:hypothetical protein A2U01_0017881 [Trifolium medium]|uniref:Uncharacterized protein n=1 Tax=Trifolium medium TaxID=97028 RepID=A0A392NAN7_9FABA|nr:hypothetical protein [Trifolium medium]
MKEGQEEAAIAEEEKRRRQLQKRSGDDEGRIWLPMIRMEKEAVMIV